MNENSCDTDNHIADTWRGEDLSLYLDRCQIDTPPDLVELTWRQVAARRPRIGRVVDFGAGDGRFAQSGSYDRYVGYEIDARRSAGTILPAAAAIIHGCAFSQDVDDAELSIGNPPFVRNQDLPTGWRQKVADQLEARSGVRLSGLANAWQYFFLLSIISTAADGLCAIVIPYEWVSRPSATAIRTFIREQGWDVDVYRMADATFGGVLTTSSITIVDKRERHGRWRFFQDEGHGDFRLLASESGAEQGHLPYAAGPIATSGSPRALRGLSPGSQQIFTFTEAERARHGLVPHVDVVRCVTSLRPLPATANELDGALFDRSFRYAGHRCWLLNVSDRPGDRVRLYLDSIAPDAYGNSTCAGRPVWWRFTMPETPALLVATSFKGPNPKTCCNAVGVKAVGGVAGIYGDDADRLMRFVESLAAMDLKDRIVAHAKGLRKIEINQLNALLADTA